MKLQSLLAALVCSCLVTSSSAASFGSAFNYQGRLMEGGAVANGLFDLSFTLFNAATGGVQVASSVQAAPVAVSNGLFAVSLDFGMNSFDGNARGQPVTRT